MTDDTASLGPRARLRRLGRDRRLWEAVRLLRAASAVRPRVGFLVGELRGGVRRYRTSAGITVFVRHRTRDIDLVNEIVGHLHAYEPPADVVPLLTEPLTVLDLGGNSGMFGAFALGRWAVERMCSAEPDPGNAALLARTIDANRAHGVWSLLPSAVANRSGHLSFLAGRLAESRLAVPGEPGVPVSLTDVFSLDHAVDLCKMDIEAGEWAILGDERFARFGARVIVLEWHSLLAPEPDARRAVHRLLRGADYRIASGERASPDGFTGVLWAYRPR